MKKKGKIKRLEILVLDQDRMIKGLLRRVGQLEMAQTPSMCDTPANVTDINADAKAARIKRNRDIPGIEIEGHDVIGDPETPWTTASSEQILDDVARHINADKAAYQASHPAITNTGVGITALPADIQPNLTEAQRVELARQRGPLGGFPPHGATLKSVDDDDPAREKAKVKVETTLDRNLFEVQE